ncbi:MAG: LamG domain-containing protein [Stenotrophomonas sp.]|uniref:LamG domain-containing protein n=1 Tax=Stenotrophomonas sp. TaxID=69392 RepID=UPI0013525782|nr:LamG domain-containing protein [Stenotrophomonas sp.]MTI72597.1 LamG domain-containing protein [Stenotrophomonas sp.]MTI72657.1 LamG domain-containing protein [Stenotrophomonas sp.]
MMLPLNHGVMAASVKAPADPFWANVVSLLHFDGPDDSTDFIDETGRIWTAVNFCRIDTAYARFGGASGHFDFADSNISTPDSDDFDFGAGDFTIEAWIRPTENFALNSTFIISQRASFSSDQSFSFLISQTSSPAGKIRFIYTTDGSTSVSADSADIPLAEQWSHVAAVRSGNSLTVYLNGVGGVPRDVTGVTFHNSSESVLIGRGGGVREGFTGHIDELRVTKGVARYTADFTPPDAPFPGDAS